MRTACLLGIVQENVESLKYPGVFNDIITEVKVTGSLLREAQYPNRSTETTTTNVALQNRISIIMDSRIKDKIFNIRWAKFKGVKFAVTSIEVKRPRIFLTLGGVYNESTGKPKETTLQAKEDM